MFVTVVLLWKVVTDLIYGDELTLGMCRRTKSGVIIQKMWLLPVYLMSKSTKKHTHKESGVHMYGLQTYRRIQTDCG